ncbi:hypothetical protein HDU67_001164 [Dinochytrium kinnereticum]|nr:hypothetical protein HDU67_001164 [Dinochytrium kinnereticum]
MTLPGRKGLEAVTLTKIETFELIKDTEDAAIKHLELGQTALSLFFEKWNDEDTAVDSKIGNGVQEDPFASIPCDLSLSSGASDFRREVWNALRAVPAGSTLSYEGLAAICGKAKAVRAAGTAVGLNPIPLIIPCHRIMGKNGDFRGYSFGGVEVKRKLLAIERVVV